MHSCALCDASVNPSGRVHAPAVAFMSGSAHANVPWGFRSSFCFCAYCLGHPCSCLHALAFAHVSESAPSMPLEMSSPLCPYPHSRARSCCNASSLCDVFGYVGAWLFEPACAVAAAPAPDSHALCGPMASLAIPFFVLSFRMLQ